MYIIKMNVTTTDFAVPGDILDLPIDPRVRRSYYSTDPHGRTVLKPDRKVVGEDSEQQKPMEARLGDKNLLKLLQTAMGDKKEFAPEQVESAEQKVAMPSNLSWRI